MGYLSSVKDPERRMKWNVDSDLWESVKWALEQMPIFANFVLK